MKNLDLILTKYSNLFLILIFIIALTLRWLYLPQKAISFAYDQARDAFLVQEMLQGHLKILGPPVSGVPGLFHGVLYYYVIAPSYFFGHGDPVVVAYYLSFISSLGVFAVYILARLLSKSKVTGLIASLLFAFSFEASQYANLLTNASMGVWFVPFIYIGLYLWINKKTLWAPVLTGLAIGLSIQSEVALAYHLAPLLMWLLIYRKNITRKDVLFFVASFVFGILPMIVAEIRFGFSALSAIGYLFSGKDGITESKNLSDYVITLFNQSGKTFAYTIFPINIVFGGVIGFLITWLSIKNKSFWGPFLASYIFAYAIALPFGGWNMRHILVGVAPGVAILIAMTLWKYCSKNYYILAALVLVICIANTVKIVKENKNGQTIFPLQLDLVLSKELQVIDYTYQNSDKNGFSISTLTSPLFVNTLWSYLYNWYGKSKYEYLPSWVGRDQVGQLGNNLPAPLNNTTKHFFIMEPTYGIPDIWVTYAKGDQDAMSVLVDKKSFGELVVEERKAIIADKK